jgi:hypothetical protein
MTTYSLFEYLLELNQEAAMELIENHDLHVNKENRISPGSKKTLLEFPRIGDNELRVSEQELRFVIVNLHGLLNQSKLTYAVEVPTEKQYSFSGNKKRSGSTDLAFYDGNTKVLNIEFKAKMPPQGSVNKDVEKLIKEDTLGAWCYIFINENSGTLKSIFKKLEIAINKFGNPCKPLFFSFFILNKRTLITRKGNDGEEKDFRPDLIFNLKYSDYNKLPSGKHFIGDWQIDKF